MKHQKSSSAKVDHLNRTLTLYQLMEMQSQANQTSIEENNENYRLCLAASNSFYLSLDLDPDLDHDLGIVFW